MDALSANKVFESAASCARRTWLVKRVQAALRATDIQYGFDRIAHYPLPGELPVHPKTPNY
ncbi:hypothetical protein [Pseudomonas typographi]|uniref:hypothetical protein n=1 Tax=Pseudomonas typographi TaxID=2715964 RepID=UPI001683C6F0|nr:hypothetical protein [Pseudomonas typographi]MBD1553858.1 hypothetical protein [Pseudomonas typographi]